MANVIFPEGGPTWLDLAAGLRDPLADHWDASDHALVLRSKAAQATLDAWRDKPFRIGHADCVRLIASHVRRMGHKVRLPHAGAYRGVQAARMLLQARGFESLPDAMDKMGFDRIPPAAALVGDVIELPSEIAELGTLTVALGNGRVLGWHEDAPKGACVLQPLEQIAAWRVEPK